MGFIKGFSLGLLSSILFILLAVFGITLIVNQIAFSPHFLAKVVNNIDYSSLVNETMQSTEQGGKPIPPELLNAIKDTIANTQPLIKERMTIGIDDTYSYLLGKHNAPNLKTTLGNTFMNPDFVAKFLSKVDMTNLTQQILNNQAAGQTGEELAFEQAIVSTIKQMEPSIKQQMVNASDPVFKYLLGQTSSIDLRTTVRTTLLNRDFVTKVIDNLDVQILTGDTFRNQMGQLPGGIKLTNVQLDQIINILAPSIRSGLKASADPIGDYLVGARSNFSVTVPLAPAMPSIKPIVKQAFVTQLPANLQGASQVQIDQAYEIYWVQAQSGLPSNFTVDSSMLGTGVTSQLNEAFTNGQKNLTDARNNIDKANLDLQNNLTKIHRALWYFRAAFIGLIILLLLIIGGIVLIHRSVKGVCRDLGITFLSYGVIEFIGLLILKNVLPNVLSIGGENIPQAIESLIPIVFRDLTNPLFVFSLVCLIGGIALIVVSIVYPKKQTSVIR